MILKFISVKHCNIDLGALKFSGYLNYSFRKGQSNDAYNSNSVKLGQRSIYGGLVSVRRLNWLWRALRSGSSVPS